MVKDYDRQIRQLYKREGGVTLDASIASQARILMNKLGEKWAALFRKRSGEIVDKMISQVDRASTASLNASLKELSGGLTIKTPDMPADLKERVTAAIAGNVNLITSIPAQYHDKVAGTVLRSIEQGGEGAHDIYKMAMRNITEQGISVHKRAAFIARQETSKVSTILQSERMRSVGVTKFIWRHGKSGAEPRQEHIDMDGNVYSIDDPPVIMPDGTRGLPGDAFNCRCWMQPVIEFGGGEQQ